MNTDMKETEKNRLLEKGTDRNSFPDLSRKFTKSDLQNAIEVFAVKHKASIAELAGNVPKDAAKAIITYLEKAGCIGTYRRGRPRTIDYEKLNQLEHHFQIVGEYHQYREKWQQHLALALKSHPITTDSYKILDLCFDKMRNQKSDTRIVQFDYGEVERLLGKYAITYREMNKLTDAVISFGARFGCNIEIHNDDGSCSYCSIFTMAKCKQNDYGLWQLEFTIGEYVKANLFVGEYLTFICNWIRKQIT